MQAAFHRDINRWRSKILQLPIIPFNYNFTNAIVQCKIPFSAIWSPNFVPKPDDWPEQCRVVGTFTEFTTASIEKKEVTLPEVDTEKFATLIAWMESGGKPIFIGFGSMVIKDTERLQGMIMDAAKAANTRIVVQSSWSKLDVSGEQLCHNVGPVSHDWLLPQCGAVIHHGECVGKTIADLFLQWQFLVKYSSAISRICLQVELEPQPQAYAMGYPPLYAHSSAINTCGEKWSTVPALVPNPVQ